LGRTLALAVFSLAIAMQAAKYPAIELFQHTYQETMKCLCDFVQALTYVPEKKTIFKKKTSSKIWKVGY